MDIKEDIKCYKDTLSYTSSKVDYGVEENLYMLPSHMNLKIRLGTAGYNNRILISVGDFSLGKNEKVNSLALEPASGEPVIPMPKGHPSHKAVVQQIHANELAKKPSHEDERIDLILLLTGGFVIWNSFKKFYGRYPDLIGKYQRSVKDMVADLFPD